MRGRAGPTNVAPGAQAGDRCQAASPGPSRCRRPDQLTRLEGHPAGTASPDRRRNVRQPPGRVLDGEGIASPHLVRGARRPSAASTSARVLYVASHAVDDARAPITVQAACARIGLIPPPAVPPRTRPSSVPRPRRDEVGDRPLPAGRSSWSPGGFQRTNFASDGGNYVTESRAIASTPWRRGRVVAITERDRRRGAADWRSSAPGPPPRPSLTEVAVDAPGRRCRRRCDRLGDQLVPARPA